MINSENYYTTLVEINKFLKDGFEDFDHNHITDGTFAFQKAVESEIRELEAAM